MFRFCCRLTGWLLGAVVIAAVSAVAFHWVRSQPRCVLPGWLEIRALTPDGSLVLAHIADSKGHPQPNVGELQVWSTHDGKLVRRLPGLTLVQGLYELGGPSMGRHYANPIVATSDDDKLHVVDWQQGHVKKIPLGKVKVGGPFGGRLHVNGAPGGRWLIAEQQNYLFDLNTEKPPVALTGRLEHVNPFAGSPRSFSPDGRWLLLRDGDRLIVRDLEAGRERTVAIPKLRVAGIAPDGQTLALVRAGEAPKILPEADQHLGGIVGDVGRWTRSVEFRALPDGTLKARFELPEFGLWGATFAPDSRSAAFFRLDSAGDVQVVFVELPGGRRIAQAAVPGLRWIDYSSDGALLLCNTQTDDGVSAGVMIDAATGQTLWHKPGAVWLSFTGAADGSVVFNESFERAYQILDARTGEARVTLPSDFRTANHIPSFTPDGQRLVIGGWRARARELHFWEALLARWFPLLFADLVPGIIVVDAASGEELLRLMNRGQHGEGRYLSDDGEIVISVDGPDEAPEPQALSVWEVSPRRAWTWAIATAALCGALTILVRGAWRRWRRGTTATRPAVP